MFPEKLKTFASVRHHNVDEPGHQGLRRLSPRSLSTRHSGVPNPPMVGPWGRHHIKPGSCHGRGEGPKEKVSSRTDGPHSNRRTMCTALLRLGGPVLILPATRGGQRSQAQASLETWRLWESKAGPRRQGTLGPAPALRTDGRDQ